MFKEKVVLEQESLGLLVKEIKKGAVKGFNKLEKCGKTPGNSEEWFRLIEAALEATYDYYSLSYCRLVEKEEV